MAFHMHWIELCKFESDLGELHHISWQSWRHPLSALAYAKLSLPFGSCQIVGSDFGSALVWHLWVFWSGWTALASTWQSLCSCLRHLLRFCYELEVTFVTGVWCCQHHFNVPVTNILKIKKQFLLFLRCTHGLHAGLGPSSGQHLVCQVSAYSWHYCCSQVARISM